jgi:hypothetical protein
MTMATLGISQAKLEAIELRLIGADKRPWAVSGFNNLDQEGRRFIHKGGKKALIQAQRSAVRTGSGATYSDDPQGEPLAFPTDQDIDRKLILLHRTANATDDMLDFIVKAPDDVEVLLREVRRLQEQVTKLDAAKRTAVADLLKKTSEATRANEQLTDIKRAWRTLCRVMKP